MHLIPHAGGARALLEAPLPETDVGLAWLGQAGFAVRHAGRLLLVDPYLSDFLAGKYAGTALPHVRMVPVPAQAGDLQDLDLVLCSHRHGDHMDPGSLATLAGNSPRCRFVVPRAEVESAAAVGLDPARLIPADDGDRIDLRGGVEIEVIPSAHETLQVNARGEHHFLGFVLRLGRFVLYHCGDSVVYEGLAERLRARRIDLALLPVNGRSARLASQGIAGNMTLGEARELCLAAGIGTLMPHHFGMFALNTADPDELRREIGRWEDVALRCVVPEVERYYVLK